MTGPALKQTVLNSLWLCCLVATSASTTAPGHAAQQASSSSIELTAGEIQRVLRHGPWPPVERQDPGNELSGNPAAELLGRALFVNPALSGNKKISCASCHQAQLGYSDNQARATGIEQHLRNTQSLFNADQQRWLGWDGGADSLWGAALRPMLSSVEMAGQLPQLANVIKREPAFTRLATHLPQRSVTPLDLMSNEVIVVLGAKAIAAYVRRLRSPRTPFDKLRDQLSRLANAGVEIRPVNRSVAPDYPAAAWRGLKIFVGKGRCHLCHYGPNFSNGEFHDIGRPFIVAPGQVDPGRYRGIQRVRNDPYNLNGAFSALSDSAPPPRVSQLKLGQVNWGQWRTPSLRNLAVTQPFMHDGSLNSLQEVIDWYNNIDLSRLHSNGETILQPLRLSDRERDDLVAFLLTLSP